MSILVDQLAIEKNGYEAIDEALGKNAKSPYLTNRNGNPISMKTVIKSLPEIEVMFWDGTDYVTKMSKSYWFIRSDQPSVLKLYGEPSGNGKEFTACCYYGTDDWCHKYGDFGYPSIHKALEQWAYERGWHFEFDDAASASLWS
tara:strand:- start:82 stop:513 length:432 start_codon:yes stop_codon:yes gene_type:complete